MMRADGEVSQSARAIYAFSEDHAPSQRIVCPNGEHLMTHIKATAWRTHLQQSIGERGGEGATRCKAALGWGMGGVYGMGAMGQG